MTAKTQAWYWADISLKHKTTGAAVTVSISNWYSSDAVYFPVLLSVSGVGSRMQGVLPATVTGSIEIDNKPNSLGFQRRFSDYLDTYTPIEQNIVIYAAYTTDADFAPAGDKVQIFKGRVSSVALRGQTCSVSIESRGLPKRFITKALDSVSFPSIPAANIGRHLPIVFGTSVEVAPVRVSADGLTTSQFAYATTLGATFPVGGVQQYYAKDFRGEYQAVASVAAVNTSVYGYSGTANLPGINPAATGDEYLYAFATASTVYALVAWSLEMNQGTAGTQTTNFTVSIYESSAADGSDRVRIAEAKKTYTTNATGYYSVYGGFQRPVVLKPNKTYYFGWSRSSGTLTWAKDSTLANQTIYIRTNSVGEAGYWATSSTIQPSLFGLYGVRFVDTKSSAADFDGLGYAYIDASQTSLGGSPTDLSLLDLVLAVNGLTDDSSGTITGVASTQIVGPKHAMQVLDREWNGSAWVAGSGDFTQYNSTHLNITNVTTNQLTRTLKCASSGRTTWQDMAAQICGDTACRIALTNSTTAGKSWGIWAWGVNSTVAAVLSDEDCEILSVELRGSTTIVNRFIAYYNKQLRFADVTKITAEGSFAQYGGTLNWYNGANVLATALTSISDSVYGRRQNASPRFDFIGDSQSAEVAARYILSTYAKPHVFAECIVPFQKYQTLDLLQVVEIVHPDLPAYFGTASNADLPSYSGTSVEITTGNYYKRANRYRAQIEGRQIEANVKGFPLLRLTLRILDNYPTDMT